MGTSARWTWSTKEPLYCSHYILVAACNNFSSLQYILTLRKVSILLRAGNAVPFRSFLIYKQDPFRKPAFFQQNEGKDMLGNRLLVMKSVYCFEIIFEARDGTTLLFNAPLERTQNCIGSMKVAKASSCMGQGFVEESKRIVHGPGPRGTTEYEELCFVSHSFHQHSRPITQCRIKTIKFDIKI